MKLINAVLAGICAMMAVPSSAAVIEFEFSGIFDAPNEFAPVGTAFTGKFGYDSALAPTTFYKETSGDPMSYALYEDPSIFIEATFGGNSFRRAARAGVSNLEMDGFVFWVSSLGPDEYISINYDETAAFDIDRLGLPASFLPLGVRPDPLNDWEGVHVPSSEFDFYHVGTGKSLNAAVSKIGPSASALPSASAVPEPANWALMIAGFGLVGAAMRRRQATDRAFVSRNNEVSLPLF